MAQFQSCRNDTGKAGAWKYIHQPRLISYTICPGKGRVEKEGADDKSSIVATTQCRVVPGSLCSVGVSFIICGRTRRKPPWRTQNIPSFFDFEVKSISWPSKCTVRVWIGFGIKSLYPMGGRRNNNHLIVETTDPDHYQNLINCCLPGGWSLHQISRKCVHEFFRYRLIYRGDNKTSLAEVKMYLLIYILRKKKKKKRKRRMNFINQKLGLFFGLGGGGGCQIFEV